MTKEKLFSKRVLSVLTALFTAAALSSCASTDTAVSESETQTSQVIDSEAAQPTETEAESTSETEAEQSKTAVVYFSATGTTTEIAKETLINTFLPFFKMFMSN